MPNQPITYSKLKKLLFEEGGNITAVANHLGCERQTVYNWMNRKPDLAEWRRECEEFMSIASDMTLMELMLHSKKDEVRARLAMFYKTHKDGWTQKHEVESNAILPIGAVQVVYGGGFEPPEDIEHEEI